MKKISLSLLLVAMGITVSTIIPQNADASVKLKDREKIEVTAEDNEQALKNLEEKGISLGNSRFDKSKMTLKAPDLNQVVNENISESINFGKNLMIAPAMRMKTYSIDSYGFSIEINNPNTGSNMSTEGIRCNELAPEFTPEDNGIVANMFFPSSSYFYFSDAYTQDNGTGVWDGGYYYR